jgi:hypothetical protein
MAVTVKFFAIGAKLVVNTIIVVPQPEVNR